MTADAKTILKFLFEQRVVDPMSFISIPSRAKKKLKDDIQAELQIKVRKRRKECEQLCFKITQEY